jgi:hypothetical protein
MCREVIVFPDLVEKCSSELTCNVYTLNSIHNRTVFTFVCLVRFIGLCCMIGCVLLSL